MDDIFILILPALVGLGIGYALGILSLGLQSDKDKSSSGEAGPPSGWVEIARFFRRQDGKEIIPEINGKLIHTPDDLSQVQRAILDDVYVALGSWVPPGETPPGVPTSGVDKSGRHITTTATSPETLTELLPTEPDTKSPVSWSPVDLLARAIQSDTGKLSPPPRSIAAQVDEILQEKLAESPLAGRGIRIMELPGRGMVVMVGLDRYEAVDEVPDAEIRAIIRAAVLEWEQLHEKE